MHSISAPWIVRHMRGAAATDSPSGKGKPQPGPSENNTHRNSLRWVFADRCEWKAGYFSVAATWRSSASVGAFLSISETLTMS